MYQCAAVPAQDYPYQAFFAIYDGHGGVEAAEYAKNHLHVNVVYSPHFRDDPAQALRDGFARTDIDFLAHARREVCCGDVPMAGSGWRPSYYISQPPPEDAGINGEETCRSKDQHPISSRFLHYLRTSRVGARALLRSCAGTHYIPPG